MFACRQLLYINAQCQTCSSLDFIPQSRSCRPSQAIPPQRDATRTASSRAPRSCKLIRIAFLSSSQFPTHPKPQLVPLPGGGSSNDAQLPTLHHAHANLYMEIPSVSLYMPEIYIASVLYRRSPSISLINPFQNSTCSQQNFHRILLGSIG